MGSKTSFVKAEIYLDANASHPLLERVKTQVARKLQSEGFGNASSLHGAGRRSRKLLSSLRAELQSWTGLDASGWTFTSGATESLNMALTTALVEGWQVWCSTVEHSAVIKFCGKRIPEAKHLGVQKNGELDLEKLSRELDALAEGANVLLVLQSHNNETGFPLVRRKHLGRFQEIVRAHAGVRVLWDAVQSLGKSDPDAFRELVGTGDYVVVTGHKLGSLPGIGAIWRQAQAPLKPLLLGGTQEQGLRAGTEALWSALAWLEALHDWKEKGAQYRDEWARLKDRIVAKLRDVPRAKALPGAELSECLPNTLPLLIDGVRSDLMLQKLDLEGVCASSGSACQSGTASASHVLKAIGCSDEEATSFIRVSMPVGCQEEKVDAFVDVLRKILA